MLDAPSIEKINVRSLDELCIVHAKADHQFARLAKSDFSGLVITKRYLQLHELSQVAHSV